MEKLGSSPPAIKIISLYLIIFSIHILLHAQSKLITVLWLDFAMLSLKGIRKFLFFHFLNPLLVINIILLKDSGVSLRATWALGKLAQCENDFVRPWFEYLKEIFLIKKFTQKGFACLHVKPNCHPAENPNKTPEDFNRQHGR